MDKDQEKMKQENELEFSRKMLLNEHTRWNQWTLFFLGGLITIIAASDKISDRYGLWVTPVLTLILSVLWVFSALAIIKSTWSWVETIKELEKATDLRSGWKTFEESKSKWVMGDEIKGTFFLKSKTNPKFRDRALKVTYNLVRIGYVVIIASILMLGIPFTSLGDSEIKKYRDTIDSLKTSYELLEAKDKAFSEMLMKVSTENEQIKIENKNIRSEADSIRSEIEKAKSKTPK